MFDLNALIPADSAVYLQTVVTINERGEIAGNGVDVEGNSHAFVLIPCDKDHPGVEGCDYSMADAKGALLVRPPSATRGATDFRKVPTGPRKVFSSPLRFGQHHGSRNRIPEPEMPTSILDRHLEPAMEVEKCPGAFSNDTSADAAVDPLIYRGRVLRPTANLLGLALYQSMLVPADAT